MSRNKSRAEIEAREKEAAIKRVHDKLAKKIDQMVEGIAQANGINEFETGGDSIGALEAIVFLNKLKRRLRDIHMEVEYCVESQFHGARGRSLAIMRRMAIEREDTSKLTEAQKGHD